MKIAVDIFEVKLSWKGVKELEEAQQKFNDFLKTQGWNSKTVTSCYEKEDELIELPPSQSSGSTIQFQIGNENYPVKKFEVIKELLLQMIQCKDIEDLEIHDINLKRIKEEFQNFLNELGHDYNEGEWNSLK